MPAVPPSSPFHPAGVIAAVLTVGLPECWAHHARHRKSDLPTGPTYPALPISALLFMILPGYRPQSGR